MPVILGLTSHGQPHDDTRGKGGEKSLHGLFPHKSAGVCKNGGLLNVTPQFLGTILDVSLRCLQNLGGFGGGSGFQLITGFLRVLLCLGEMILG
jgi:hypothetical protein